MFHLDEYVGISPEHPASFQKYLRERFIDIVQPGKYHLIDGRKDPPADFADPNAYKVVKLADSCIQQQIHEGWFATPEEAFKEAISMTCGKIMECRCIISVAPYAVKAKAIHDTLTCEKTPMVPATLMKEHPDVTFIVMRTLRSPTA